MALRGESGWQAMHSKYFGKERWLELRAALRQPVNHVVLVNPFLPAVRREELCKSRGLQPHESIPKVFMPTDEWAGEADEDAQGVFPHMDQADDETLPCYFLDGASAIAAAAMKVEPGASVLDLCAAPGGKSLMLASMLFTEGDETVPGRLVCNEMSRPRLQRLQKVLSSFLPSEMLSPGATGRVSITNVDAASGGPAPVPLQRLAPFDYVLVDAPCTSDRHLVHQGNAALAHWAAGAVKANAERQLELLRCAAGLVKPGGVVLYATCALSEAENDGVVQKFIKKGNFTPEEVEDITTKGDKTAFGVLILPDRTPFGPMYIARLRRN